MKFKSLPDEAEASAPRKPQQDAPEGRQRGTMPLSPLTYPMPVIEPAEASNVSSQPSYPIPSIMKTPLTQNAGW